MLKKLRSEVTDRDGDTLVLDYDGSEPLGVICTIGVRGGDGSWGSVFVTPEVAMEITGFLASAITVHGALQLADATTDGG